MAALINEQSCGLFPDLNWTDVPDTGLWCDLVWTDPEPKITYWGENDLGAPCRFGPDVVTKFFARHDIQI